MNIYIDGYGLAVYLKEFLSTIRRDKDVNNCSIFNLNFETLNIDQVFVNQTFHATFWHNETNHKIPPKESGLNRDDSSRNQIISALEPYMPKNGYERKDFIEDIDNWIKYRRPNVVPYSGERINLRSSRAISIMQNNEDELVDMERILYSLKKLFFVEGTSLNTIRFTREMQGWGVLKNALENEKDIVIVDRYFFKTNIAESIKFIKDAICSNDKKKNIVIFYENDKRDITPNVMDNFTDKISNCRITFVGVNPKVPNKEGKEDFVKKVLHDRYIISNHRIIISGHSFVQYFKEEGFSANGSMFITIGSVADENNEKVMVKSLQFLQNEILNHEGRPYFAYNKEEKDNTKVLSLSIKIKKNKSRDEKHIS